MFVKNRSHLLCEFPNGDFVIGFADVKDFAIAVIIFVLNDANDAIDGVVYIGVSAEHVSAIDELHGLGAVEESIHEMAENSGVSAAFFGGQKVDARADKVKGTNDRVVKIVSDTVSVEDTFEELFRAGIDPSLIFDRPHDEGGFVFVEGAGVIFGVEAKRSRGGDAVDFACRELNESFFVSEALLHDFHVLSEVQIEDTDGIGDIECGICEGDEVDDDVRVCDFGFDFGFIGRDIEMEVAKFGIGKDVLNFFLVDIDGGDVVDTVFEKSFGEIYADEAPCA